MTKCEKRIHWSSMPSPFIEELCDICTNKPCTDIIRDVGDGYIFECSRFNCKKEYKEALKEII